MNSQSIEIVHGVVLDEDELLSLSQLCKACRVEASWVVELVQEGIIEPRRVESNKWHFDAPSLGRARKVKSLQSLGVNVAGAALALELIDEIDLLRHQVALMKKSFEP